MSELYKKVKKKVKNLGVRARPWSRPGTPLANQSLSGQIGQSISSPHLPATYESNTPATASCINLTTGLLTNQSLLSPASTPAPAPAPLPAPALTSTSTTSAPESSSKVADIAKDVFKTTLVLLDAALTGVPVPGVGVIKALIEIVKMGEVRDHH